MNILLVSQNYHPFVGGVETHARQVAHELAKRHRVRVAATNFQPSHLPRRLRVLHTNLLAPAYRDHQDGPVPVRALTPRGSDRLRMLPIAARVLPGLRRRAYDRLDRFGYPWYRAVFLPRLREVVRDADVVHSLAGGYLGWTVQEAAREREIPFVCTPFVHPRQWGDDPASVTYYRRAVAVIALTESDRGYLRSLGVPDEKLRVIGVSPDLPPTADAGRFRQRHGLRDHPLVLYMGRMMREKGAGALREAADQVWQRMPQVRFVFIGPPTRESGEWFRPADPRASMLGKVSAQEKADALAACDVFCMPSMSELLGIVYLEAWSYGKPVVSGRAPGLPELVEGNGAGIAVGHDPAEITAALVKLLENPALRRQLGERGRKLVQQQFSVAAVVGALESLYEWQTSDARRQTPVKTGRPSSLASDV